MNLEKWGRRTWVVEASHAGPGGLTLGYLRGIVEEAAALPDDAMVEWAEQCGHLIQTRPAGRVVIRFTARMRTDEVP